MPRLTYEQRIAICTLREEGVSIRDLARRFGVAPSTIKRLNQRVATTGTSSDRARSGRPRLSNARADRVLRRLSTAHPRFTARTLRQLWHPHVPQVSRQTVSRRLVEMGLPGRIAKKKPLLTARHRQVRLQWARERQHMGVVEWGNIFFSDETPVHLIQSHQVRYVRRPPGQRDLQRYSRPTVHSGGGKVNIWGGFTADGTRGFKVYRGNLNSVAYQEILAEAILPLDLPGNGLTFQQDNAPAHRSRSSMQFFEENGLDILPWPPQSPDLNPCENLWSLMKGRLEEREIHGMEELRQAAEQEFNRVTREELQTLIASMPRRIKAVIAARGGTTKY